MPNVPCIQREMKERRPTPRRFLRLREGNGVGHVHCTLIVPLHGSFLKPETRIVALVALVSYGSSYGSMSDTEP